MNRVVKVLEKLGAAIFRVERALLILAVALMITINFAQVICRYLLKSSISWCEQGSVILFMMMILIGGNIAMKTDHEIRIEVIRFKDRRKDQAFRLIQDLVGIAVLACLLAGAWSLVGQSMLYPQALATLPLKYYHLYMMMIAGFALMLLEKITYLLKRIILIREEGRGEAAE